MFSNFKCFVHLAISDWLTLDKLCCSPTYIATTTSWFNQLSHYLPEWGRLLPWRHVFTYTTVTLLSRSLLFGPVPTEKVAGRDNTMYQDSERVKKTSSASKLFPSTVGPLVRGHRRSMTVPLYQPDTPGVYKIAVDEKCPPPRPLDLNLSCILENSHSGGSHHVYQHFNKLEDLL